MPKNFSNILQNLNDGYNIEDLPSLGIRKIEIQDFIEYIDAHGLTIENAKALNMYSCDSEIILAVKNQTKSIDDIKDTIAGISTEFLEQRHLDGQDIDKVLSFVKGLDYDRPLYQNFEAAKEFAEENDIPRSSLPTIRTAIKEFDTVYRIDGIISEIDDVMSKSTIEDSMTLYRAIKIPDVTDETVMDKLNTNSVGYTSTSPTYETSFAKYEDYNVVIEMQIQKGTHGIDLAPFSDYDSVESEILIGPNKLEVSTIQSTIDHNGNEKIILGCEVLDNALEHTVEIENDSFVIE